MSNLANILVVDDEAELRDYYALHLRERGYEVTLAADGQEALQRWQEGAFDLVLSDVSMPEMDGYQFCLQLRENEQHEARPAIPFIFVSGLIDLDEKLRGYEVGGDDYIAKPVDHAELLQKIGHLLKIKSEREQLKMQVSSAQQAAMQAMSYSSDLGRILEFFQASIQMHTVEQLANALLEVMDAQLLECSVLVQRQGKLECYGNRGAVSPLEQNIIEMVRAKVGRKQRFYDFDERTVINHDEFSLLIKNMPIDEPERYGILKDTLGNFCVAFESRLKTILSNDQHKKKEDVVTAIHRALDEIGDHFEVIQKANVTAIEDMIEEVEDAMLGMGLSEQQEDNLRGIVMRCLSRTNENFYQGVKIQDGFEKILSKLERIAS